MMASSVVTDNNPAMVLVTHAVDDAVDADQTLRWLQKSDRLDPLRRLGPIAAASSWRICSERLGSSPYRYFDCLFLAKGAPTAQATSTFGRAALSLRGPADGHKIDVVVATLVAPPGDDQTTQHMLFLPHSPRAGAVEDGFEQWLRDIDSPVINGLPGVVNYSGWRVDKALQGSPTFTNFDLMYVAGLDGFDQVYGDPAMLAHEKRWIELWGIAPGDAIDENFPVLVAERIDRWNRR